MERIGSLLWDVTFLAAGFCIGVFLISMMLAGFLCFTVESSLIYILNPLLPCTDKFPQRNRSSEVFFAPTLFELAFW